MYKDGDSLIKEARVIIEELITNKDEKGYIYRFRTKSEKESMRVTFNKVRKYMPIAAGHIVIESGGTSYNKDFWLKIYYDKESLGTILYKVRDDNTLEQQTGVQSVTDNVPPPAEDTKLPPELNYLNDIGRNIKLMSKDGLTLNKVKAIIGEENFNLAEVQSEIRKYYPKEIAKLGKKPINFSDWPPTAVDILVKLINDGKTKEEIQKTNPPFGVGQKLEELIDLVFEDDFDINAARSYVKDSAQY